MGNNVYKWTYTGDGKIPSDAKVIFSQNGGDQTSKDGWEFVNGGYYSSNGYVKTIEGAGEIVDDPVKPVQPGEWTAYFDNSGGNWDKVYVWVWDSTNSSKNYTGGSWPGLEMTEKDPTTGYFVFTTKEPASDAKLKIFFNNGNGTQTKDLDFTHRGIYTAEGFSGQTGVGEVSADNGEKYGSAMVSSTLRLLSRRK